MCVCVLCYTLLCATELIGEMLCKGLDKGTPTLGVFVKERSTCVNVHASAVFIKLFRGRSKAEVPRNEESMEAKS